MKYLFTFLLLSFGIALAAQVQYGKITYLRTREMVFQGPEAPGDPANMKVQKMFEQMKAGGAFDKTFVSTFGPEGFASQEMKKAVSQLSADIGGGRTITIMNSDDPPLHFYTNTTDGSVINSELILDKQFLVSGTPDKLEWTLLDETVPPSEATAGLDLRTAMTVNAAGDTILAGYAPSLPARVGPLNYYGLPGAIITLEIPQGEETIVFRATGIEVSPTPLELPVPTEGTGISLEKFEKQRAKKMESSGRTTRRVFIGN